VRLKELKPEEYHLYVDLDGVVADLHRAIKEVTGHSIIDNENDQANPKDDAAWREFHAIMRQGHAFFADLHMMPGADKFWSYIRKYEPKILTATGKINPGEVDKQKRVWVDKHLPGHGEVHTVIASRHKAKYAWPDSILIDDRMKSIGPWREKGGVGILYKNADQAIAELKALGL
jgi:hypothetical protein